MQDRQIIIWKEWLANPQIRQRLTEKWEEEELRLSQSTSTRFSSKSTPTSESQRRPWTSWTPSSTTPSTESPLKDPSSSDSTREELSHPERSNLLSSSSSPENSPDTPSLKEPKPSLNTSNNDFILAFNLCSIHIYLSISHSSLFNPSILAFVWTTYNPCILAFVYTTFFIFIINFSISLLPHHLAGTLFFARIVWLGLYFFPHPLAEF